MKRVLAVVCLLAGVARADDIPGTYETIEATDGKTWGGPAGPALLRLVLRPHRDGELVITPNRGGATVKLSVSWRYDAEKKRLAVKVANERVAGAVDDLGGGVFGFAGSTWRKLDANAPPPAPPDTPVIEEPEVVLVEEPKPPPRGPAVPQESDDEAPPIGDRAEKLPPPAAPRTETPRPAPASAPAAAKPAPATAPAPVVKPEPPVKAEPEVKPKPALNDVIPISAPVAPAARPAKQPRLPAAAATVVGLWMSTAVDQSQVVLELAADGTARVGVLQNGRLVALRTGGRWGGDGKSALEVRFGAEVLRGPSKLERKTLTWMGAGWKRM